MGSIAKPSGFGTIKSQTQRLSYSPIDSEILLWNQDEAILDTTELICRLMKEQGVTRAELAKRLGTTKGNVTQMLDGSRNLTIRTVSDVLSHLGHKFKASCEAEEEVPNIVFKVEGTFSTATGTTKRGIGNLSDSQMYSLGGNLMLCPLTHDTFMSIEEDRDTAV